MAIQLRQPSIVRYRAQFGLSFLKDSYVINLQIENNKSLDSLESFEPLQLKYYKKKDIPDLKWASKEELYNELFTPVDYIGNVFNRLAIYKGDIYHKSSKYFGKTKEDGRLTQAFFITFDK